MNNKIGSKGSVVSITFAFNNSEIIKKLEKRGTAIKEFNFDESRTIEEEIAVCLKENDKLTYPV